MLIFKKILQIRYVFKKDVHRLKTKKERRKTMKVIKYLAAMATVLGVTGVIIGGTISYMTKNEQATNVFTIGDLDIG